jgi:hypothetical protein
VGVPPAANGSKLEMHIRNKTLRAAFIAACIAAPPAFAVDLGDNTTLGGLVYVDLSYINLQNDNSKGVPVEAAPTGTGFDIKRFYLIVNHTFNDIWSANLTTDAQYTTASTATVTTPTGTTSALTSQTSSGGATEVFIKKLYLQGNFSRAFAIHVGSYDTAWIPLVEDLCGCRWIDKVETDRLGFQSSADWGAYATGSFGEGDLVSYSVGAVDGAGYRNPTRTKFVDLDSRVAVKPLSWLTFAAGFYDGHLGQITASNAGFPNNTATKLSGLAAINLQQLRLGIEYFNAKNYKTVGNIEDAVYGTSAIVTTTGKPPVSDVAAGYSAWVTYNFAPQWAVFGRFDHAALSEDVAPALTDQYYNFGVSYEVLRQLDVALVYKHEEVSNGSATIGGADANASYDIGGATALGSGVFKEYGVYLRYGF